MTPPAPHDVVRERLTIAHGIEDGAWTIRSTDLIHPSWDIRSPLLSPIAELWRQVERYDSTSMFTTAWTFFPLRPQDV